MNKDVVSNALVNAGATVLYIVLLIAIMTHLTPPPNTPDTFFTPVVVLLLFIVSAAVTGFLVVGRPILWYIEGRKQDAIALFATTIGILFVAALFFLLIA